MPSEARAGRCFCGEARYEVAGEPLTLIACHCTDCQTVSGAGFTLTLVVRVDSIEAKAGEIRSHERPGPSGRTKTIFRCARCATALWGVRPDRPTLATVYAGTLDSSASLVPIAHIWTRSAQAWIAIPEGALRYEQEPPDPLELVRAWKARAG